MSRTRQRQATDSSNASVALVSIVWALSRRLGWRRQRGVGITTGSRCFASSRWECPISPDDQVGTTGGAPRDREPHPVRRIQHDGSVACGNASQNQQGLAAPAVEPQKHHLVLPARQDGPTIRRRRHRAASPSVPCTGSRSARVRVATRPAQRGNPARANSAQERCQHALCRCGRRARRRRDTVSRAASCGQRGAESRPPGRCGQPRQAREPQEHRAAGQRAARKGAPRETAMRPRSFRTPRNAKAVTEMSQNINATPAWLPGQEPEVSSLDLAGQALLAGMTREQVVAQLISRIRRDVRYLAYRRASGRRTRYDDQVRSDLRTLALAVCWLLEPSPNATAVTKTGTSERMWRGAGADRARR